MGCFLSNVRKNALNMVKDLWASSVVLCSILLYVFIFSSIGNYFFRQNIEGFIYFDSLQDSYYNMLVLLTTANFPDVMLPAYESKYGYCAFFIIYLIIGVYFLLNLMLANVFANFKTRLEQDGQIYIKKQSKVLANYIEQFDPENKGFLSEHQTVDFFTQLFNLKIREVRRDYNCFKSILKKMDLDDY